MSSALILTPPPPPPTPPLLPSDDIAPGYSQLIPLPMHLGLIRVRAAKDYYRQPAACLGDIRTLYLNCRKYNGRENAEIVGLVSLVGLLLCVCLCVHASFPFPPS